VKNLVNRINSFFNEEIVGRISNNVVIPYRDISQTSILSKQRKIADEKKQVFSHSNVRVIIPTLNERENIRDIIYQLTKMGFCDVLVVDGHSNDGTVECAQSLGARVILQNGHGKGAAVRDAFMESLNNSRADIIVMMDADGSMSPGELPSFIDAISSGADVAKGSRFLPPGSSEDLTLTRRVGNKMLTMAINLLFLTNYTDLCYGYIAFNRNAVLQLSSCLSGQAFEIETEICVKAKTLGLNVVEIPSFERLRRFGSSNLHAIRDGLTIFRLLLKEYFQG
jgi:glycosyltransferase involved in cell wall biosynthesis